MQAKLFLRSQGSNLSGITTLDKSTFSGELIPNIFSPFLTISAVAFDKASLAFFRLGVSALPPRSTLRKKNYRACKYRKDSSSMMESCG